jgi:hypothetical protein
MQGYLSEQFSGKFVSGLLFSKNYPTVAHFSSYPLSKVPNRKLLPSF